MADRLIINPTDTELRSAGTSEVQRLTATGYSDEVQTITPSGDVTDGTWTITYDGQTTAAMAFDIEAAAVQTALNLLSNVPDNGIVVTGGAFDDAGAAFTLTFSGGAFAKTGHPEVTVSESFTGVTLAVATTVAGPTGTFTIECPFADDEVTAAIAYNATAAQIEAALELVGGIGPDDIVCAGGPLNTAFVSITFGGKYAFTDVDQVIVAETGFVAGDTVEETTTTAGVAEADEVKANSIVIQDVSDAEAMTLVGSGAAIFPADISRVNRRRIARLLKYSAVE